MKTVLFVIFLNLPNGAQVDVYGQHMPEAACLQVMRDLWASPSNPVAFSTDDYEVVTVDAYCEPVWDESNVETDE